MNFDLLLNSTYLQFLLFFSKELKRRVTLLLFTIFYARVMLISSCKL